MKIYTEADVKKAVKVLFFEGAGCAERGDLENCRIRTAFRNDEGKGFYLELSGFEKHKWTPDYLKHFENVGHIDYCYELGKDGEKLRADIERKNFEYSKQSILDFVNREMGCSFTDIVIADMFYDYRVHKNGGGYNFMEDHDWNVEKAHAVRQAFFDIDMKIRKQLGEKYSKISLCEIGTDTITVRCYASDKSMLDHGMDPKNRFITVEI
jgi:hypothetical protein